MTQARHGRTGGHAHVLPVAPCRGRRFLETVCLVRHLDPLPSQLRGPFVEDVIRQLPEPLVLDYVRLNMRARRA